MFQKIQSDSNVHRPALESPRAASYETVATDTLFQLPIEIKTHIARYLGGRDRLNWATTSKQNLYTLKPQLESSRLARQAADVNRLVAFRALLGTAQYPNNKETGTIRNQKGHDQLEALSVLATRIVACPLHERADAKESLLAAYATLFSGHRRLTIEPQLQTKSDLLAGQAASVRDLATLQALLGSVANGEVGGADTISGQRPDLQVRPLKELAARIVLLPQNDQSSAIRCIVNAIAKIDDETPHDLNDFLTETRNLPGNTPMEWRDIASEHAIKGGEPLQDVIQRFGITDLNSIGHLKVVAWGTAVKKGMSMQEAADIYGFRHLDMLANEKIFPAVDEVCDGEPLQFVIAKYGITMPEHFDELTTIAIKIAASEVTSGKTVQAVIARHGLTEEDDITEIIDAGIEAAEFDVKRGVSVQDAADRYGTTDANYIVHLSEVRIQAAIDAVRANESVEDVIKSFGFTDPGFIAALAAVESERISSR